MRAGPEDEGSDSEGGHPDAQRTTPAGGDQAGAEEKQGRADCAVQAGHEQERQQIVGKAIGGISGQNVVEGIAAGALTPAHGWLQFCELATRFGWKSSACHAYLVEILKRAGR